MGPADMYVLLLIREIANISPSTVAATLNPEINFEYVLYNCELMLKSELVI